MPTVNATRLTVKIALCLTTPFLTAYCDKKPVQIAADTSCVRFRHIDVTEWQVADMKKDPNQWRPLAVQIKSHNDEYEKACVNGEK